MSFPIGAVSPMIGETIFRTDYVVVPVFTENGAVMTRASRNQAHIEQVLYRERRAWYVSINELRDAQLAHALRRFQRPRVDRCVELLQESATLLRYLVPPRPDPTKRVADDDPVEAKAREQEGVDSATSTLAYQWGQRWLREELVRLRINAAFWLMENASFQCRRAVLPLDLQQVWHEAALSSYEMWFAPRQDGVLPVLIMHGDGVDVTVPLPAFDESCSGVGLIASVRNSRSADLENRNELTQRIETCVAKLWGYLPGSPTAVTHGVSDRSFAYPLEDQLERNPEGGLICEAWQREHIQKQRAETTEKKRRESHQKKKRKSSKIKVPDVEIGIDEDLFD